MYIFLYLIALKETDFFMCCVLFQEILSLHWFAIVYVGGVGWGNLLPLVHTAC